MDEPNFQLFKRFSAERVATALTDTPVVMLIGPRQCGKTTLVRQFVDKEREYVTLDDDTVLAAARSDPSNAECHSEHASKPRYRSRRVRRLRAVLNAAPQFRTQSNSSGKLS